jgi:hypothetical protein
MRPTLEALEDRSVPAVLTVTSLADSFDPGTLRSAVVQANNDGAYGVADAIQFAPDLSGTITLVAPLELSSAAGVEIDGSPAVTLSGGGATQVFYVDAGASAVLNGLTITNGAAVLGGAIYNLGSLTLNGDTLSANSASQGGAIFNAGTLTLDASALTGNSAQAGGALLNFVGNGNVVGTATVQDNCDLSGNVASQYGGAIYNLSQLSISGGTLWSNAAGIEGGAIMNDGAGSMFVEGANLSYNSANSGGAVFNSNLGLIDGSVLASNSAQAGGAVFNNGTGQLTLSSDSLTSNTAQIGGAVGNTSGGQLTLSSDSLGYNTAELGGAVANYGMAVLNMSGNTVTGNTAVQGGGLWNAGALSMTGDNVFSNYLRLPTPFDSNPNVQPLGSGLYDPHGGASLDPSTYIGNNFNADGSLGGDIYNGG